MEENRQTRLTKYSELTEEQKLQDDCDVQATNIILHGLPPDVYAFVNHHEVAKAIWDKFKLLMKGTELSYQERECKLYDLFDKFAFVQGETLYEYYWRLSQLINDMHTIRMTMQQVQLYAYLSQHERHAHAERVMRERYPDPLALHGENPIDCINKALTFMSAVASRGNATNIRGTNAVGQPRVVKCYNCQGEGHMARQCTQPKRPRNAAWFKEKLMLAESQEAGQILDEEQLAFLADPRIDEAPVAQQIIPHNAAF
ncbi:copia protein [Tanacetum coccineum]